MYFKFKGRTNPEIVYCDDGFYVRVFDYRWWGLCKIAKLYIKNSWQCFIHPKTRSIVEQCLHTTLPEASESYIECLLQLNEIENVKIYLNNLNAV